MPRRDSTTFSRHVCILILPKSHANVFSALIFFLRLFVGIVCLFLVQLLPQCIFKQQSPKSSIARGRSPSRVGKARTWLLGHPADTYDMRKGPRCLVGLCTCSGVEPWIAQRLIGMGLYVCSVVEATQSILSLDT